MPKQVQLHNGVTLTIEDKAFASGGEGDIYIIISPKTFNNQVVKIYKSEKRTKEREFKTKYLVDNPPLLQVQNSHHSVIWPTAVVYQNNKFLGLTMHRAQGEDLELLLHPKSFKNLGSIWNRFNLQDSNAIELRLKICFNIAVALHQIHSLGRYVLVDMKPVNIKIQPNGLISFIDIDSVQVVENGKLVFSAPVATPEYTPPEYYKGMNLSNDGAHITWDQFSIAVIFYRLLCGIHPFTGSCNPPYNACSSLSEMVENGLFPYSQSKRHHFRVIPPPHQQFTKLDESIRKLFIRCFDNGHSSPQQRPTTDDWCNVLSPQPVIKIDRPLPSSIIDIPIFKLSNELSFSQAPTPALLTASFLYFPDTNIFKSAYYNLFGRPDIENIKVSIIKQQKKIKTLILEKDQFLKEVHSIILGFKSTQDVILKEEKKIIENIKIDLTKKIDNLDILTESLCQEEIKELKSIRGATDIKLKSVTETNNRHYNETVQPIKNKYDAIKQQFKNQLNQVKIQEEKDISFINNKLHSKLFQIKNEISVLENNYKLRIDKELGLDNKNYLIKLMLSKYIIKDNASIIFGMVPKIALNNLKLFGINTAADYTDTAVSTGNGGNVKKSNGKWVKIPQIGDDRAESLKKWLSKVNKETNDKILTIEREAMRLKSQISTLMTSELALAELKSQNLKAESQKERSIVYQRYSPIKNKLLFDLEQIQEDFNKEIFPFLETYNKIKLDAISNHKKIELDYDHQKDSLKSRHDDLHFKMLSQIIDNIKHASNLAENIWQETQKKLFENIKSYNNQYSLLQLKIINQCKNINDAVVELDKLKILYKQ
ncbi:hypothetical protein [Larkinella rosea]|uniref:Protein kinase domain-containing protein n=1 Tax=Larkinella rosea TaxID=2025312 RepID=A0A3P1BLZ6_9BACT|nr:hypothetical protein [Larkinella rosea]RRB02049.1 hypothetical protein EHT25_16290 [Larkinella rosea]